MQEEGDEFLTSMQQALLSKYLKKNETLWE